MAHSGPQRGASRKRALTLVGLTSLIMPYTTQSTPMRQHRVSPAERMVPYAHTLAGSPRRELEKFWMPSSHSQQDEVRESSHFGDRHLARSSRPQQVLVDASILHPDYVFRRLRQGQQGRSPEYSSPATWSGNVDTQQPVRETRSTTTTARRSSTIQTEGFVNANVDGEAALNETDFNVTANTVYNVSASIHRSNHTNDTSTVVYTESERTKNATLYDDEWFTPIRIRAFLSEMEGGGQYLTDAEHWILLQDIVTPALLAWSAALRVDPVKGNLTVDKTQLIDGISCGPGLDSGLPSVVIPSLHLTDGVNGTDLIIYLSVGFVDVNRTIPQPVPDMNATVMMETNMTAYLENLGNITAAQIAAVLATNATNESTVPPVTPPQACSGEYLAASSFCSTDQYDRPTAAILHICIGDDFFSNSSLQINIMTVMHELGHALGFNSVSLAHFRRPDGSPITPRLKNGAVPETLVECAGPQGYERTFANLTLPSKEILQFRTVRGGVRVAEVVTKSVRQVVRNHFDCQDLPGAELESGEFLPLYPNSSSCIGDHWERRLLKMDLMNPIVDDLEFNPRFSTITLAYFADSGWYQVDLSRASHAAGWGRGAGCPFIESTCINADGQVPTGYEAFFCNESPSLDNSGFATDIHGCTPDFTKKAACSMGQYSGALPYEYQYFNFTYGSDVGGSDPYMDYCPVFTGFTNGLCTDAANAAVIRVDQMERFGDRNSRCIAGTRQSQSTALCLRIACVVEDKSFRIQVDGTWRSCPKKGAVIVSKSGQQVICPDPIRICPTFYCVRDCLGTRRICDYGLGECVCNGTRQDPHCGEETDDPFFRSNASTTLPDEDSPLSDYYVPTARMLQNEEPRFQLEDWEIVVITFGLLLAVTGIAYLIWRRYRRTENGASGENGPDDFGNQSVNPNKHKMMATVVVDLRMNDSNLRDRDALANRASETDQSMTETDGGASHVSNLSIEMNDMDEDFEPIDPLEPLPCPSIVRRRGRHSS